MYVRKETLFVLNPIYTVEGFIIGQGVNRLKGITVAIFYFVSEANSKTSNFVEPAEQWYMCVMRIS